MGHHTRGHDDVDPDDPQLDAHLDEHIDPAEMTPEARLAELGAILAAGIGRLRTRAAASTEKVEESSGTCLELPPEPGLDGRRVVSTRENGERR
jgi:hypothetical protein